MSGEFEAAGTAIEGALLGAAVEQAHGQDGAAAAAVNCLNCGAQLNGYYCSACGQKAEVHRSFAEIGHDIMHSVLHFDGKFWRTLPMLALRPGELTRRYVHGERAKFVSPMALFLFSIFMMFAVFSFIGMPFSDGVKYQDPKYGPNFAAEAKKLDEEIAATQAKLANPEIPQAVKIGLEAQLNEQKAERNGLSYIITGKPKYIDGGNGDGKLNGSFFDGTTGFKQLDNIIRSGGQKMVSNPSLALYKLQSNGYKFAWLLIPLSLPFIWLATLGVRGHHFYDHAVFTTYSIAFMCLLFLTLAILSRLGVSDDWLGIAFIVIPPVHLYKQLRYAYGLSRVGAVMRLLILSLFIWIVIFLFAMLLLFLGLLG
ncbi:MAG: DUF3667 domain-containing protein [Sphingorhabdus sp.]